MVTVLFCPLPQGWGRPRKEIRWLGISSSLTPLSIPLLKTHILPNRFPRPQFIPKFSQSCCCCCCSVAQLCLTLCNPMDCSSPGFPVLHSLPEFAQTHVHGADHAIDLKWDLQRYEARWASQGGVFQARVKHLLGRQSMAGFRKNMQLRITGA